MSDKENRSRALEVDHEYLHKTITRAIKESTRKGAFSGGNTIIIEGGEVKEGETSFTIKIVPKK